MTIIALVNQLILTHCFCTDSPKTGNPAGIVFNFSGGKADKQKLARQLMLPVTVFIDNFDSSLPVLHFFYPDLETNLCLHGALAAVFILMDQQLTNHITVATAAGKLLQAIKSDENIVQIKVSAESAPVCAIDSVTPARLLNLTDQEISQALPMAVASVGSPKLLVPVKSIATLGALRPNFAHIKKWSIENQINGVYVYAQELSAIWHARGFNPKTGQNEDAATGVAAAALSLVLKKNLVIHQGQYINKPSIIMITYHHPEEIYVGGSIKIY